MSTWTAETTTNNQVLKNLRAVAKDHEHTIRKIQHSLNLTKHRYRLVLSKIADQHECEKTKQEHSDDN